MNRQWNSVLALMLVAWVTTVQGAPALKSQKHSASAEKNANDGVAFWVANKSKEGVVTLESGLQYRILTPGDGAKPTLGDSVVVQYRGTLIDGTEFYNTYARSQPGTVPVRNAIPGLREALQLMPAGSKWQVVVPPHLAFGRRGAGGVIRANTTLIFETELLSIKSPDETTVAEQAELKEIKVSFKVDPRLTRSLYMGDRWVSPPSFTAARQGKTSTVEASAEAIDGKGKRVRINPEWIVADPDMVEVARGSGEDVKITVKRAGESTLKVVSQGVTKELAIKAVDQRDAIAVEFIQLH